MKILKSKIEAKRCNASFEESDRNFDTRSDTKQDEMAESELDDLFRRARNGRLGERVHPTKGGPLPNARDHGGRPIQPAEYKTVENLLHRYTAAASNAELADSFMSANSYTTDGNEEFYDCNAGSLQAAFVSNEGKIIAESSGKRKTSNLVDSALRQTGVDITVWDINVEVRSVSLIILQQDVHPSEWPPDTEWYLSPIPLDPLEDESVESKYDNNVNLHPAPAVLRLGVDHFVIWVNEASAHFDLNPNKPKWDISILTLRALEYLKEAKREEKLRGLLIKSHHGEFRCNQIAEFAATNAMHAKKICHDKSNFIDNNGVKLSDSKAVDGCDTDDELDEINSQGSLEQSVLSGNRNFSVTQTQDQRKTGGIQEENFADVDLNEISFCPDATNGEKSLVDTYESTSTQSPITSLQTFRVEKELKRTQRKLNPDFRIFGKADTTKGKQNIVWKMNIQLRPLSLMLDLGNIQRLVDFQKSLTHYQPAVESWYADEKIGAKRDWNEDDGISEPHSPRSPSSSQGDFSLDLDDFQKQQVHLFQNNAEISLQEPSQQNFELSADVPMIEVYVFPCSSENHSWNEVFRMRCDSLSARNHATEQELSNGAEKTFNEGDLWNIFSTSITLALSKDMKSNCRDQADFETLLSVKDIVLRLISRTEEGCEDAIFHPFLAPGTKISATETEAFFQRLWDPYRVWEPSEGNQSSNYKQNNSKEAKTLSEFEVSCESRSNTILHVEAKNCQATLTRKNYCRLMSTLQRVATALIQKKKDSHSDIKKSTEESHTARPNKDPHLLPQHPDHVPAAPRIPNIGIKVSHNKLLAACQHGMALCWNIEALHFNIVEEDGEQMFDVGLTPGFSLAVRKFRWFNLSRFNHEHTTYMSVSARHVELLSVGFDRKGTITVSMPVLSNTLATDTGTSANSILRKKHVIQLVFVNSAARSPQQQQIALNLNSVTLGLPNTSIVETWSKRLREFFIISNLQNSREDRKVVNSKLASYLYVHATDCAIDYNPTCVPGRGVLMLTRISLRVCDLGRPKASHLTMDLSDLRLYVLRAQNSCSKNNQSPGVVSIKDRENQALHLRGIEDESLIVYCEQMGFIRVASIDAFQLQVQMLPKAGDERKILLQENPLVPDVMVELTRGVLGIQVCADSASVLSSLMTQVVSELTPPEKQQDVEISFQDNKDLLGGIDRDAFKDEDLESPTRDSESPSMALEKKAFEEAEKAYQSSLMDTKNFVDYFEESKGKDTVTSIRSETVLKTQDEVQSGWFEKVSIVEDHFVFTSETDRIYKAKNLHPPRTHPRPKFTFKMHSVEARIQFFGGQDFKVKPKVERDNLIDTKHLHDTDGGLDKERKYSNITGQSAQVERDSAASSALSVTSVAYPFKNSPILPETKWGDIDSNTTGAKGHLQTVSFQSAADAKRQVDPGLQAFVQETYVGISRNSDTDENGSRSTYHPQARFAPQKHGASGNKTGLKYESTFTSARIAGHRVDLDLKGVHLVFNAYTPDSRVASYTAFTVDDVNVLDMVSVSDFYTNHLLTYDRPKKKLRESGSSMIRIKVTNVRPDPVRAPDRQEARVHVSLLPIRVRIDQDTSEFFLHFLQDMTGPKSCSVAEPQARQDDSASDMSAHLPDDASTPPPMYIQSFRIEECNLCLDYRPKRIDLEALRAGEYAQLAHLLRLQEVRITLGKKVLRALEGWGALVAKLGKDWSEQILAQQIHRCLAGIQPLRSIIKVGSGVVDLVVLPLEQFRRDGRVIRGLQKGMIAFINSLTVETINVATSLALGAHSLLETVDTAAGKSRPDLKAQSLSQTPRHYNRLSSERSSRPGLREGLLQAYEAFSGSIRDAARRIIVVPADQVDVQEYTGTVRNVVTAVPSAVARSMSGIAGGVNKLFVGVKMATPTEGGRNEKKNYETEAVSSDEDLSDQESLDGEEEDEEDYL
eukprot:CAMPEP_0184504346 /NCGR_PEP_ID=MMETSP0113_2-20130426/52418_1 /TAXON_ID=91329 /ORGANISM="Norrisiella sphaerica, Strain BC52" /LENGTH=1928 /DNA_ID=CAMNT_0026893987 /DNA_START=1168 /DNA_END=6954 /DNA_ORIENTATION=-